MFSHSSPGIFGTGCFSSFSKVRYPHPLFFLLSLSSFFLSSSSSSSSSFFFHSYFKAQLPPLSLCLCLCLSSSNFDVTFLILILIVTSTWTPGITKSHCHANILQESQGHSIHPNRKRISNFSFVCHRLTVVFTVALSL